MAEVIINVNGTPKVYNSVLLSINGDTEGIELNGYIKSIRYTTGTQTMHVTTINPLAQSITLNPVCSTPSGSITFVAGAFDTFYSFINDRFTKFTMQFIQYTTGDLGGKTKTLSINTAQLDDTSGSIDDNSPNNLNTIGFKATSIVFL